ncbi:MAG: hypothetical protein IT323_10795, partial [Anaerolineae bacterium]|nr:hypothetical protein [Anaerolineae bacterium]
MNRSQTADRAGVLVPFTLDDRLGPNEVRIALVMCAFTVKLAGQFSARVHDTSFEVPHVDLTGAPFA